MAKRALKERKKSRKPDFAAFLSRLKKREAAILSLVVFIYDFEIRKFKKQFPRVRVTRQGSFEGILKEFQE
jgi:hypothetical protein